MHAAGRSNNNVEMAKISQFVFDFAGITRFRGLSRVLTKSDHPKKRRQRRVYFGVTVPMCTKSLLFSRQTYSRRSQPGRNFT